MNVKVLGPGCPACDRLMENVRSVLSSIKIVANLEHVRDISNSAEYGSLASLGVFINEKIKIILGRHRFFSDYKIRFRKKMFVTI